MLDSCEWTRWLKEYKDIQSFVQNFTIDEAPPSYRTLYTKEADIVEDVCADRLYGMIDCSVRIPEKYYSFLDEMPPGRNIL